MGELLFGREVVDREACPAGGCCLGQLSIVAMYVHLNPCINNNNEAQINKASKADH